MATFTITDTKYWDSSTFSTRAGGDTYNINAGTLIIDSDTRYCQNSSATTGTLGNVSVSTSLGGVIKIDASDVWHIAYTGGIGVVAAGNSIVAQGTASASLCNITSSITTAPTAAGSTIPASGIIKVHRMTGGNYASGTIEGVVSTTATTGVTTNGSAAFVSTGSFVSGDAGKVLHIKTGSDTGYYTISSYTDANTIQLSSTLTADATAIEFDIIPYKVTSSGAQVQGFIEVVGDIGANASNGCGLLNVTGGMYYLDNTNGSRNQILQCPTYGSTNSQFYGVEIETSPGSNTYEWYPAIAGTAEISTSNFGTDIRNKYVQSLTNGQFRIGHNGTTNIYYLPASGCKTRIPNAILCSATAAARGSNATPASGPYTYTNREGGNFDVNYASLSNAYMSYGSYPAAGFTMTNCTLREEYVFGGSSSSIYGNLVLNNNCVGCYTAGDSSSVFEVGLVSGSATITNNRIYIRKSSSAAYGIHIKLCGSGTVTGNYLTRLPGYNGIPLQLTNCLNFTLSGNYIFCTAIFIVGSSRITSGALDYCNYLNSTSTTNGYVYNISTTTYFTHNGNVTSGVNGAVSTGFATFANANDSSNITISNIGTAASPYSQASAIAAWLGGSRLDRVSVKRCYTNGAINGPGFNINGSNIILQNIGNNTTASAVTYAVGVDPIFRSCYVQNLNAAANGYVMGTFPGANFGTIYQSTTTGYLLFQANSPSNYSSTFVTSSLSATSKFTGGGRVLMLTSEDSITIESPYYVLGYTAFTNSQPLKQNTSDSGTYKYEYDINTGSGYSGTWKNIDKPVSGCSVTNANANMTLSSTSGIQVGDRILGGTGLAAGVYVSSITDATHLVMSANATGTYSSQTYYFNHLPAETINYNPGFKIKLRVTVQNTANSNVWTSLCIPMTTNSNGFQYEYPLYSIPATLTLTDLKTNTEVRVYAHGTTNELGGSEDITTGTYTYNYTWEGTDIAVDVVIIALNYIVIRYDNLQLGQNGVSLVIQQQIDRQYSS